MWERKKIRRRHDWRPPKRTKDDSLRGRQPCFYNAWTLSGAKALRARSVPAEQSRQCHVSVSTRRSPMSSHNLEILDNIHLGQYEPHTHPIALLKCKKNIAIYQRWKCSDWNKYKLLQIVGGHNRFKSPLPQFCTKRGPSPPSMSFNCFWESEINQSIFELCECKENT